MGIERLRLVRRIAPLVVGLALLMGACGNGDEPTAAVQQSPEESSFPVTLEGPNGPLTIEEEPEAIVSLSSPATESLFAIGAGDQVIAATRHPTTRPRHRRRNSPDTSPISKRSPATGPTS